MSSAMAALARGANVRIDNKMMIDAEFQLHQMKSAKENQKKKEAWLLGGDIEFGKALDPYNKGRLDKFNNETMDKISDLMQDQGIMSDPRKLAQLKQYKSQLLDNEIIDESIQFQIQKGAMTQFMNDPRNQEFLEEPEMQIALQQSQMYEATGSSDGNVMNRDQFVFKAPPVRLNTADIISKNFGALEAHGHSAWGAGVNGYRQFVTRQDMRVAANNIYNDKSLEGKAMRREWNELDDEQKAVHKNDPINWITQRGKGYAAKDMFHAGQIMKPPAGGGAGGSNKGPMRDKFHETVRAPLFKAMEEGVPNPQIQTTSLIGALVGPDGRVNAQKARMYDAGGNMMVMDLGLAPGSRETGVATQRTMMTEKGLLPHPDLGMEVNLIQQISVEELRGMEGNFDSDVLDLSFWNQLMPFAKFDEANDFDIEDRYKSMFTKTGRMAPDGSHLLNMHYSLAMPSDGQEVVNNSLGKKQNAQTERYNGQTMQRGGYEYTWINGRWE